ncbi:Protein of unknown function DUF4169 [Bartonella apihabitans]|uniref:DUF4169 family protein n=1 Tax=Bartonella apihabitans TaxID=2750929 RepID=A0A1U9MCE2_9HYPH|nr:MULTISPECIES: DUF4169 family protein [Bartonella]AQT42957.1 protein of unknown function (DUF4169) [Bartonella apihabitans]AQT45195.1 protein of unknown function (DUF4169) [Bartonella apihabitans]MBH9994101.1 DUF4169 family protein [Bartonella sp. P0291]MBH9997554.1 DUF4169 family protein [Bartonella sp. M0192]MBH9999714.1 DUF4169 family protein [Bartonella sp. M0191]
MADLVNLRQFRKQKKRQNDETKASENRVIFGRTKVERNFEEKQKKKTVSFLDLRKIRHDEDEG